MTLSHHFLKCENMLKAFLKTLFSVRNHIFMIISCSTFLSQLHFQQFYLDIIYTLWISFRGGSDKQLFQLSQQFATVRQCFSFFVLQHQHSQLFIYFQRPVNFPGLVDFPSVRKFSTPNFHFPINNCQQIQLQYSF